MKVVVYVERPGTYVVTQPDGGEALLSIAGPANVIVGEDRFDRNAVAWVEPQSLVTETH